MIESPKKIKLYTYNLKTKYPLPVLGNTSTIRKGFLLIQEVSNGYKIGEAAPLPSFHKTTFSKIQRELTEFIHSPERKINNHYHSVSLFAIDMLNIERGSNSKYIRTINTLYREGISQQDIQHFKSIKLKVGRGAITKDLENIQDILNKNPNIQIRLDANCLWSFEDTLIFWDRILQKDLQNSIEYIEDPVQDSYHLSYLSEIPLALDTLFSISKSEELLSYTPVAIILKPTLQGGFFKVKKYQEHIHKKNINTQIIISSTFESSIGIAALMKLSDHRMIHGLGTLQYFCPPKHDLVIQSIQQDRDQLILFDRIYTDDDIRWDLLEEV